MNTRIFIGSSSEASALASAIREELAPQFEARVWNEQLFELGVDTLHNLLRIAQCHDFALLVLTADDFTRSRGQKTSSPRDNVVFELGLFMGALGTTRVFPIVASPDAQDLKLPTDLLGNTAVFLPKGLFSRGATVDKVVLRTELSQLIQTLKSRSGECILQNLPSTALAIGYFNNFILPVCKRLAEIQQINVGGRHVKIAKGNFHFTVVLPQKLSDACIEGAKRFCDEHGVREFELATGARHYPFYVSSVLKRGRVEFFDYPTTLRASYDAVRVTLARSVVGDDEYCCLLDDREITNFEKALQHLIQQRPEAVGFRNNVEIVIAAPEPGGRAMTPRAKRPRMSI